MSYQTNQFTCNPSRHPTAYLTSLQTPPSMACTHVNAPGKLSLPCLGSILAQRKTRRVANMSAASCRLDGICSYMLHLRHANMIQSSIRQDQHSLYIEKTARSALTRSMTPPALMCASTVSTVDVRAIETMLSSMFLLRTTHLS
jgi:hypothetical protein